VATRRGGTPEAGGDAAVFVEESADDIERALTELVSDRRRVEELKSRGRASVLKRDWSQQYARLREVVGV
ncbi:glycosyltransferase family 4 protein, partial [Motilibacter sp. E257]